MAVSCHRPIPARQATDSASRREQQATVPHRMRAQRTSPRTKRKKRRKRGALSCFSYVVQRQNRCTMPTPTPTMLRDDDGVELKPSPIVAVALMMLRPFVPSVWPFAR